MALSTATITGDIADHIGNDFDIRRTKIWLTTNVPSQTIVDSAGDKIRLGSGNVTLASDGTFSATVWVPGAGSNPASWQTTVHIDYPDRNTTTGRAVKSFGPFTVTTSANLADLVAEMPVQPEYLATVLETVQDMIDAATGDQDVTLTKVTAQAYGYTNHGDVSGAQTFNGPNASHRFSATGPTTITLAGYDEGMVATLICFAGAEDVTVNNAGDVELADNTAWSAEYALGTWVSGGGGGTPAAPDTTPPSNVVGLTVTGGSQQVSATWTASTDTESPVSYRWRVWLTSGGSPASGVGWTTTTSPTFTKTGLAAGAYTAEVYAYSTGGSTPTVSGTATVTAPLTTDFLDTFSRGPSNISTSPNPDLGSPWIGSALGACTISGGRLNAAGEMFAPRTVAAREIIAIATAPTSGETWFTGQANGTTGVAAGFGAQINAAGRVYTNLSSVSFNISGGSNPWTANGYLTAGDHTIKITHEGTLTTVYVDGVKVLEGTSPVPTYHGAGIYSAGGGASVDSFEVKV